MRSLDSYVVLELFLYFWIFAAIASAVVMYFLCIKFKKTKKCCIKLGIAIFSLFLANFILISLMFMTIAFQGTLTSLLTATASTITAVFNIGEFIVGSFRTKKDEDKDERTPLRPATLSTDNDI